MGLADSKRRAAKLSFFRIGFVIRTAVENAQHFERVRGPLKSFVAAKYAPDAPFTSASLVSPSAPRSRNRTVASVIAFAEPRRRELARPERSILGGACNWNCAGGD